MTERDSFENECSIRGNGKVGRKSKFRADDRLGEKMGIEQFGKGAVENGRDKLILNDRHWLVIKCYEG
jgi:hypothetical protein